MHTPRINPQYPFAISVLADLHLPSAPHPVVASSLKSLVSDLFGLNVAEIDADLNELLEQRKTDEAQAAQAVPETEGVPETDLYGDNAVDSEF